MRSHGRAAAVFFSLFLLLVSVCGAGLSAGAAGPAYKYTLDSTANPITWVHTGSIAEAALALDGAEHGELILQQDAAADAGFALSSGNVVLDLSGYTLDFGSSRRCTFGGGSVTLRSGTPGGALISSYGGGHFITVNGGSLTVESGTISHTGAGSGSAVRLESGSFAMTGGKIASTGKYTLCLLDTSSISGGAVVNTGSSGDALYCSSKTTSVTGGSFSSSSGYALYDTASSGASEVKGGYFYSDNGKPWSKGARAADGWRLSAQPEATGEYAGFYAVIPSTYTVTWVVGSTTVEQDTDVRYGGEAKFNGAVPTQENTDGAFYSFLGWNTEPDADAALEALPPVTGDVTYYAVFSENTAAYTLTWQVDSQAIEIDASVPAGTQPVFGGPAPEKAATDECTYTFLGWSTDPDAATALSPLPPVTADTTYYAVFSREQRTFQITWMSGGTALETDSGVTYGSAPTFDGTLPMKPGDGKLTYTFAGWAPAADDPGGLDTASLPAVRGDTIYYAVFTEKTVPSGGGAWHVLLPIVGVLLVVPGIGYLAAKRARRRSSSLFD